MTPNDTSLPCEMSPHPELEDDELLANIFLNGQSAEHTSTIDVLEANGGKPLWHEDVDDELIRRLVSEERTDAPFAPKKSLRVFFVQTDPTHSTAPYRQTISLAPSTMRLLHAAGLSGLILCEITSPDIEWAKMGDNRFLHRKEDQTLSSFEMSYRYQSGWDHNLISFTQFTRTRNSRIYFCINYPIYARTRLKRYLDQRPELAHREFFLDALASDECLRAWQFVISEKRAVLIDLERTKRDDRLQDVDSETRTLHRVSKDWHMLLQDISDFSAQLQFLQNVYTEYMEVLQKPENKWAFDMTSNTDQSFQALESRCNIYRRWVANYRDRTNIRINLLFHLANQREAKTSREIAVSTAEVAKQAQRDSASMITIAAVTMFFLPGTFISAILSSTFFEHRADGLSVSNLWWVLPATTVPLMILVFAVWLGWQHFRTRETRTLDSDSVKT